PLSPRKSLRIRALKTRPNFPVFCRWPGKIHRRPCSAMPEPYQEAIGNGPGHKRSFWIGPGQTNGRRCALLENPEDPTIQEPGAAPPVRKERVDRRRSNGDTTGPGRLLRAIAGDNDTFSKLLVGPVSEYP